jgi:hypothetical protein
MNWELIEARYETDYRIHVTFRDGAHGVVDLKPLVERAGVFAPLRDLTHFKAFTIDPDWATLTWQNGSIDIAPETLYEMATGRPVRHAAEPPAPYGEE